jgi:hypothetical protein
MGRRGFVTLATTVAISTVAACGADPTDSQSDTMASGSATNAIVLPTTSVTTDAPAVVQTSAAATTSSSSVSSAPSTGITLATSTPNVPAANVARPSDAVHQGTVTLVGVNLDKGAIVVRPEPPADLCWPNEQLERVDIEETPDRIVVTSWFRTLPSNEEGCIELAVIFDPVRLDLERRVGRRLIVDAAAPNLRLKPEIEPGAVQALVHLDVARDAVVGEPAPDGTVDLAYLSITADPRPDGSAAVTALRGLPDLLFVEVPAVGSQAWVGLGRQRLDADGYEPRMRSQLVTANVAIAPTPTSEVIGHRLVLQLSAGALTVGDNPRVDPTKIRIYWAD